MRARTLIAALFGVVCAAARAAPGNLDNTFGTGGSVITNFSAEDVATSVAIQSDGKIVVAGHCVNGAAICVARYSSTGVLDTSFNSSGSAKTGVNSGTDKALALVIQGDGKIVVSGACQRPFANTLVFATEFCVVRYTMTGALDTSFNSTGIVQLPVGVNSFDRGQAVAMQADGRIVVVGACGGVLIPTVGQIPDDMCIARFTTTGTLDTSFNGTGKVVTAVSPAYDGAYSILIQPDGKIVVSGACANSNGTVDEFCMLRYTANGALDATFNATGILSFPMGSGTASANSVALQADGKYVLAGRCSNGTNLDFCMVRVTAAGALDCSFNATGKVATAMGSLNDVAYNVALEPDGKIVLAGNCQVLVDYFPCLARYTSAGVLDASFNATEKVIASANAGKDIQRGMALQADGKIVVVGNASGNFLTSRYEGTPPPPCRLDIDGDGSVLETTDSLIHARIAIGIVGNAVTNGIGFPVAATRKT